MDKSMEPGGGGRFAAFVAKAKKKNGVDDPDALAASAGRKKYGSAKFQAMALRGREKAAD